MPAGVLEAHCQQTLADIASISQRIRSSVLRYANGQHSNQILSTVESLSSKLETIRRSADTILEVITLQNRNINESVITWLFSGELSPCLHKLKEIYDMLELNGRVLSMPTTAPALPLTGGLAQDDLNRAVVFFNEHENMFRFLLDPNPEHHGRSLRNPPPPPPQPDTVLVAGGTLREAEESGIRCIAAAVQKEFIRQKLDEVSRWLAALDCTEKHLETHRLRQHGTCMWFPKTAAYKVWRAGKSTFLWLHGKAGCGKSVLVASTIEHLRSTLEAGEVLVYFYCDFQNERSTRPAEMMRSLLSQLFHHFHNSGIDPGALPNWILEQKRDTGALLLDDLDRLANWVRHAANHFPPTCRPIIVIDALDECANTKELLRALTMLIPANIRLLVTSRPQEIFDHHLGKYPSLSFREMGEQLAADMDVHITQELDSHAKLRSADTQMKRELRVKLHEKAEGRFRWIQCQLDTLKRCSTAQELQEALDDLPGELESTYERILGKIDERRSEGKLVRRALAWMVVALVPLRLTQLVDGLSIDIQQGEINHGTQSLGHTLVHALSSLASHNEETGVIGLSHHTVKEYLMGRTALPMYRIVPLEAHIEVTEMCMFYITIILKQAPFRVNHALLESFPMLSYVFTVGFDHLAHVDPGSTLILDIVQSFALKVQHYPSHWDLLCELREDDPCRPYPPWPSSRQDLILYILIAYSSIGLFRSFLSRCCPLKPRVGTNPLVYAADLWKAECAITLLGRGADINKLGLVVDDSRHALPLEVAVDLGNDALVGELLQRGSLVPSELLSTAVCMPWCSARVLVQLVQTGEFAKWAREIGHEKLYRAIFNSARPNAGDAIQVDRDHVVLARRLREVGQNLDPNSSFGAELIERALHAAHASMLEYLLPPGQPPPDKFLIIACTGNTAETVSVVSILLGKGVNVHAVSGRRGDTALHLAAMSPWETRSLELTKLLVEGGCDPGARNTWGETPLIIAVRRGYMTVAEHLLSRGVPLPSHILLLALQRRQKPQMIQLLMSRGAKTHVLTSRGSNALHFAIMGLPGIKYEMWQEEEPYTAPQVERGALQDQEGAVPQDDEYGEEYQEAERLELVKILLEAGCDPTSSDAYGRTVLGIAIHRGYISILEVLLSSDMMSTRVMPPRILLTALQHRMPPQIVRLLVRNGADVHATTLDGGKAPLHLAVTEYTEPSRSIIVKILVKARCNSFSRDIRGETVVELAMIKHRYTSVLELLLTSDVSGPMPPRILLTALERCMTPRVVQLLVHKGANVHAITPDSKTALYLAIDSKKYSKEMCLQLVKTLIAAGCNPTFRGPREETVLEVAVRRRYISVINFLLSRNVFDVMPPRVLLTALQCHMAPRIIRLLVRKGANLRATTDDGKTALDIIVAGYTEPRRLRLAKIVLASTHAALKDAIERRYVPAAEFLLSRDNPDPMPPHILPIALQNHMTPRIVELLVRKGADVHSTTHNGQSALYLAVTKYSEPARSDIVGILIRAGCNSTFCTAQGETVLEVCVRHEYTSAAELLLSRKSPDPMPPRILPTALQHRMTPQVVELLVHKGAEVHSTTHDGKTALHLAITEYTEPTRLDMVKILVKAGCDPTAWTRDPLGGAVLGVAIQYGYMSVLELLPPRRKGNLKMTLEVAVERGHTSEVEIMLSYDFPLPVPPHILLTALRHRMNLKIVELLLRKGVDVHSTMYGANAALCLAITEYTEPTRLDLVKILVEAGCDPTSCNNRGGTVLELAIRRGYTSVLEILLSRNISGPMPPHVLPLALQHRMPPQVVELLIRKGADVQFTTHDRKTAIYLIVTEYAEPLRLELVKILIEAGFNTTSRSMWGRTALKNAVECGYVPAVELLLSYDVLSPNILFFAVQCRSTPRIIELLIRHGAVVDLTPIDEDSLLRIAHSSYVEPTRQRIIGMLSATRDANRALRTLGMRHQSTSQSNQTWININGLTR